jgi:hypothetical protein
MLFYIFPDFTINRELLTNSIDIKIYLEDIPITSQQENFRPSKNKSEKIAIPVPLDVQESSKEIEDDEFAGESAPENISLPNPIIKKIVDIPAKSLLDKYPEIQNLNCDGIIKLLLLINKKGVVEQVELIENQTGNADCLQRCMEVAKSGKWIPAKVGTEFVDSWVTKVYKFDIK